MLAWVINNVGLRIARRKRVSVDLGISFWIQKCKCLGYTDYFVSKSKKRKAECVTSFGNSFYLRNGMLTFSLGNLIISPEFRQPVMQTQSNTAHVDILEKNIWLSLPTLYRSKQAKFDGSNNSDNDCHASHIHSHSTRARWVEIIRFEVNKNSVPKLIHRHKSIWINHNIFILRNSVKAKTANGKSYIHVTNVLPDSGPPRVVNYRSTSTHQSPDFKWKKKMFADNPTTSKGARLTWKSKTTLEHI